MYQYLKGRIYSVWGHVQIDGSNYLLGHCILKADLFEKFFRNLPADKYIAEKDRLSLLLEDFRLHNFYRNAPKYDIWKFSGSAFAFIFHKIVAYVRYKGIEPTVYIGGGPNNYVRLKPEEAGKILTSNHITEEIASRPKVKPFSFNNHSK